MEMHTRILYREVLILVIRAMSIEQLTPLEELWTVPVPAGMHVNPAGNATEGPESITISSLVTRLTTSATCALMLAVACYVP